jgi:hypothetical protein
MNFMFQILAYGLDWGGRAVTQMMLNVLAFGNTKAGYIPFL